jgi:hypothetical protein
MFSGITDGHILGLDRNHKGAASVFYYNDPQYSVPEVSYETVVDGKPIQRTVPNFGLSMYRYKEDDTHDTIIQLWMDHVTVVKDAYGILYDTGL